MTNLFAQSMNAAALNMAERLNRRLRHHRGELGALHEEDLRVLLREFLPQRFEVASGEVITADGNVSSQHDVLVWDSLSTPVIDRSSGSVLLPHEGCLVAIEVTTSLDSAKIIADALKIQKLKQMAHPLQDGWHRPTGFIFGYKSIKLSRVREVLDEFESGQSEHSKVDSLFSLQYGYLTNFLFAEGEGVRISARAKEGYQRVPFSGDPTDAGGFVLSQTLLSVYGALKAHVSERGTTLLPLKDWGYPA